MDRIKKILLVDDDSDDQFIFSEVLKKIDKKVECIYINSGEEALKMLKENKNPPPDIIFLDLNMPRLSGKECLIQIRNTEKLDNTPIVILTTSGAQDDIIDVRKLGASYFLTKPGYKELIECVAFILSEPEEKKNINPETMFRLQKMLRKFDA